MKKLILLIVLISLSSTLLFAQQQKGDSEIQISGFATVIDGDAMGSVFLKFGKYFTDNFQFGITPSVDIDTFGRSTNTTFGAGAFLTYSFLASDAKTVPYFGASYRKTDLENWDFEYGSVGGQLGLKYFVTDRTAFDIAGNYLVSIPAEDFIDSQGLVFVSFGFSYLF